MDPKTLQTIYFDSLEYSTVLINDTLSLRAVSSSGLPVSFDVSGSAQFSENQLVFTDTGQVTITARQEGDSLYAAAESVTHTVRVEAQEEEAQTAYYISGHIWQEQGVPLSEATVFLFQRNDGGRYIVRTQQLLQGHTYRFDSLPEEIYTVGAIASDTNYLPTYRGGGHLLLHADTIALKKDIEALDIILLTSPVPTAQGNAVIQGTLVTTNGDKNGRNDDVANEQLADVHIYLQDKETAVLIAHDVTNNAGEFTFAGLPQGSYVLVADYGNAESSETSIKVTNGQRIDIVATVANRMISIAVESTTDLITSTDKASHIESVRVFPNPVDNILTVETASNVWIDGTVTIRDVLGHIVRQETILGTTATFDMSDQERGVYMLTIKKNSKVAVQKIIK